MNIVLIETSGNQRYIFATNKLRENVGASELTYRVGTAVLEETIKGKSGVIPIITTSGKALFLVEDKTIAESIVSDVTKRALIEMPGLTVHGAIVGEVNDDLSNIDEKIKEVHERHAQIRFQIPSNEQRFLRLPFAAPCDTSGLPAKYKRKYEGENSEKLYSQVSCIKSENKKSGQNRIQTRLDRTDLIEPLEIYEREWIAIIHADGNGLGSIFQNFKSYSQANGDEYVTAFGSFSRALDDCTIRATNYALDELKNHLDAEKLPVVPLVLGGDDLTVLCDGQYALKFTHDFLKEFENQTGKSEITRKLANHAFGNKDENNPSVKRLGICAGVVIIKPHYPFHQAYKLAEQLLQSAKQVKTKAVQSDGRQIPCSALDFHILYDSAHSDLNEIRDEKLKVAGEGTYLFAKPYVVTEQSGLPGQDDNAWLSHRRFEELKKRVRAMGRKGEDDSTKKLLPNSKLHEIRQSLFRGKDVAEAEAGLVEQRLKTEQAKKEFGELLIDDSLFFTEASNSYTHFLDAIEAVYFWEGFNDEETKQIGESNQKAEPPAENEVTT